MNIPRISIILSVYRGEHFIQRYLDAVEELTVWHESELVVILNDPGAGELTACTRFSEKWGKQARIEVVERETLYASWNRAIDLASADILAMSNVDDVRSEDGLEHQLALMEQDPEALFCYGPFEMIGELDQRAGKLCQTSPFDQDGFIRGMHIGPFFIWRKVLDGGVLYFDEQFHVVGDYDFQVRLSLMGKGILCDRIQGYYFNEQSGLSTGNPLQAVEGNVVYLRYGVYEKVNLMHLLMSSGYKTSACVVHGRLVDVDELCPARAGRLALSDAEILSAVFRLLGKNAYYLFKAWVKRMLRRGSAGV